MDGKFTWLDEAGVELRVEVWKDGVKTAPKPAPEAAAVPAAKVPPAKVPPIKPEKPPVKPGKPPAKPKAPAK
jgi:hypothetical protein